MGDAMTLTSKLDLQCQSLECLRALPVNVYDL